MQSAEMKDYIHYLNILKSGSDEALNELHELDEDFPDGVDPYIGRRWIINAIDCGSISSIKWILEKNVNIVFRGIGGSTVLHSAMDRDNTDKYEVMELLLEAGADVNLKGINDWTPAHAAAAKNDVRALKILVEHGADLSIKTEIDNCCTPLEEARILNKHFDCSDAIKFLESLSK